jgi:hypothetical protein
MARRNGPVHDERPAGIAGADAGAGAMEANHAGSVSPLHWLLATLPHRKLRERRSETPLVLYPRIHSERSKSSARRTRGIRRNSWGAHTANVASIAVPSNTGPKTRAHVACPIALGRGPAALQFDCVILAVEIGRSGRILPTYTVHNGRSAVPFRSGRSSQNLRPALKWLACPNCHGRAVRIGLVTHHHLFLRCDDCGEPLSLPERRRDSRKLSKIP